MAGEPTILVSATVYDKEETLEQLYSTLTAIGYEVWISDKGTIRVDSGVNNFENCLIAVEKCDLFLGIISGYYGSGVAEGAPSVTHQELSKAIELGKRRWFLVHNDVLVIRNFVKAIKRFELKENVEVCSRLELRQHDPLSDMRVLDMYEEATRSGVKLNERVGNWVQKYRNAHDLLLFVRAQLGNPQAFAKQ